MKATFAMPETATRPAARWTRRTPGSAALTPEIGAERFAPIPRARIAQIFDLSQAPLPKFLARLIAGHKAHEHSLAAQQRESAELAARVAALKGAAQAERWSERKLAGKAGFTWRTWGRICQGNVKAAVWLPKLNQAASRLVKEIAPYV